MCWPICQVERLVFMFRTTSKRQFGVRKEMSVIWWGVGLDFFFWLFGLGFFAFCSCDPLQLVNLPTKSTASGALEHCWCPKPLLYFLHNMI